MRVYLACAMTNPHRDTTAVEEVLRALTASGHEVLTPHVVGEVEQASDHLLSDRELAQRDLAWLSQADCLVAEVSTPSHGVGIEVMAAVSLGKPVLAMAREEVRVSRLLVGLPGLTLARYSSPTQAVALVRAFLESIGGKT